MLDKTKNIITLSAWRLDNTDEGCVLRFYTEAGACGGYTNAGDLILQAEHLVTRANNVSYGDLRNIVCLSAIII